ncbi:Uncharacterized protein DAT39_002751, partial [Clarias magur]
MAGAPPPYPNCDHSRVNIDVADGGVHTGAILSGNTFKGQVTCRTNYTGPPARDGAATVVAKQLNVFQIGNEGINISNKGSLSHQPIVQNNTFEDTVDLDQSINIQAQNNNEGRNI